jgi:hypothetical protein
MNWIDLAEVALDAWGIVMAIAVVVYVGWRLLRRTRK